MRGEVQVRCRELIRQVCDANDIYIMKGVVSIDHIHLHISYSPKLSISDLVRKMKGCSARKLLQEYPHLKKQYWGGHLCGIAYGVWSSGNITDDLINTYLEHHREEANDNNNFILESGGL